MNHTTNNTYSPAVQAILDRSASNTGAVSIPTTAVLETRYGSTLADPNQQIADYLRDLRDTTQAAYAEANAVLCGSGRPKVMLPTANAYNNCHGRWTETAVGVEAWNLLAARNRANRSAACGEDYTVYMYVPLPRRHTAEEEWTTLLQPNILEAVTNFAAIEGDRLCRLISNNPDAVILRFPSGTAEDIASNGPIDLYSDLVDYGAQTQQTLGSMYHLCQGKVIPSAHVVAFLGYKTSTRSDRRYQWVHEATQVKSILHKIAGSWPKTDPKLDYSTVKDLYYAISFRKLSQQDRNALDCALPTCVAVPSLGMSWAVDGYRACTTLAAYRDYISELIAVAA